MGARKRLGDEHGQASPEWTALLLVVALLLAGLLGLLAPLPVGAGLARALAAKLICAVDLSDVCSEAPDLVAAYGTDLAERVRDHTPTIFFEHGMRALPVDFRSCRSPSCGDGRGDGLVARSRSGQPATAFVHVIDCRLGRPPSDGTRGSLDCGGPRRGNLYLQYWLYYADSATLRGVPVAGSAGYHEDDWESYQVRVGRDGEAEARASSHDGYNCKGGPLNWGSDLGWGAVRGATELVGLRNPGAWCRETGVLIVSGGSHAGNVDSLPCCRVTPSKSLQLVPAEPFASGEQLAPRFAIPPPWHKHVWRDPESADTGSGP